MTLLSLSGFPLTRGLAPAVLHTEVSITIEVPEGNSIVCARAPYHQDQPLFFRGLQGC